MFSATLVSVLCLVLPPGQADDEIRVGSKMPPISAGGWINSPGDLPIKTEDVAGAVVLINFWATWSSESRGHVPRLIQLQKRYNNQQVILLAMTDETRAKASTFVQSRKVNYIVGHDAKEMRNRFKVDITPTLCVVAADGKIAYLGRSLDEAEKAVEKSLKETPPTVKGSLASRLGHTALVRADELRAQKKYALAYKAYEGVVKAHGDSPLAEKAKLALEEMRADKAIMREIRLAEAKKKCESWLRMARQLKESGNVEGARKYYQRIVNEFGDTPYADTARKELADSPGG